MMILKSIRTMALCISIVCITSLTTITAGGISINGIAEAQAAADASYTSMPPGTYELEKTHASLTWKISHLGLSNYTARFTDFDASFTFDPKKPELSQLTASINPASLKTDYPNIEKEDFDKKLIEGKGWFNTSKFPAIKFTSTKLTLNDDNTGIIEGKLNFLGVTKALSLNVTLNGTMLKQPFSKKPAMGFSATGSLKRSDFGMTKYLPNIGDTVDFILEVEFEKATSEKTK